ncbi:MAG TPA: serine/threonine-protein kinase [Polyangiales bacterium]|nr:serine/threonine-protein kinase [Polyangiales bacterium]
MSEAHPEPGDLIAGKYIVEHVLGRGGMGAVYAAVHKETGKRLALKCLLPTHVSNPQFVERFLREAKAVGRVQHRHVIDVFDQGRDGDTLFIVLPLLEGKTLDELLHDEDLTLQEALVILVRAMEGVAAANEQGVLHRDLKPSNIFVCTGVSGRLDDPRVLDFGISKLDDETDTPLTRSGVAVGTPYYMPLEQLVGQRDLDVRVDVYAMGVILYEAISGSLPHMAENTAALALRLMHSPPIHLAAHRPDLPRGLANVVMRALSRDRDERYASMRAMIDALLPFISQGAGLVVREPDGVRLRTPRDAHDPTVESEMAAAAATTKPAQVELPIEREAQPSLAPASNVRAKLAGVAAVVFSIGLVALFVSRSEEPEPQPPPAAAEPASAPEPPVASLTPAPRAAAEPIRGEPSPDASVPAAPARPKRKLERKITAPVNKPEEPPPPKPAPASNIRAGELAPDEF